jgi:hypothetical protein
VYSYFIIDIETTGETLSDAILELAILHIELEREFFRPKLFYRRVFHYSFQPESSFARQHHAGLYEEAKLADSVTPSHVESDLNSFFSRCKSEDPKKRMIIGSRLGFKLAKLDGVRYLCPVKTILINDDEKEIGDYSRVIDLNTVEDFFIEIYGQKDFSAKLSELKLNFKHPEGKRHRAVFDCFEYLNRLNKYKMHLAFPM